MMTDCNAKRGECSPGVVHRLDFDFELCVCEACGQGWVRDVDLWTKIDESFQRANDKIHALLARLNNDRDKLNKIQILPQRPGR